MTNDPAHGAGSPAANHPYRTLLECLQEGALVMQSDGTIIYANSRVAKMLGKTPESLVGLHLRELVGPETRERLDHLLEQGRGHLGAHGELLLPGDEEPVRTRATICPLPMNGKSALGMILVELPRESGIDLERAQAALRDAEKRKDEFLATLAHELRNPLAPLRNGLQIIQTAGTNRGILDQAQAMMRRQLQHLVRLIDDLLDVSRLTLGKVELRKEKLEVSAIVTSAVETARPPIEQAGHALLVSLPAEQLMVEGDAVRLSQVLSNLLTNAARYTEPGGRIELRVDSDSQHVIFRVADTGKGMNAEDVPRVFEKFEQGAPGEREDTGIGIGLTISRQLVELHGGTIEGHSAGAGQGSEFIVKLPLLPGPRRKTPDRRSIPRGEAAPPRPEGVPRQRILIADDNADAARTLAMMLTIDGHDVRIALDGEQAWELADWFRPGVALLDLGMPKLNGYELARRIRATEWGKNVTVVALTGWGQPSDKAATAGAGFDHHLVKPVEPAALNEILKQGPKR